MLIDEFDIFTCKPIINYQNIEDDEKEVYCLSNESGNYTVVFFYSTEYNIDVSLSTEKIHVKWLKPENYGRVDSVQLIPPVNGFWVALVELK